MGIRKTLLGTTSVVSGLNVNVTDGIAIRTAVIFSPQIVVSVPISNILSDYVSDDTSWYLILKYDCCGHRTRWLGWSILSSRKRTERKQKLIHSPNVYCGPMVYDCSRSWVTRVNKIENALALVGLTFYLEETDNKKITTK